MIDCPTLVPAPLAGDEDKFLCMDGTWKEYNQTDYFLNSNGKWIQNTDGYYLKGSGIWNYVELPVEPQDAYVYLYNENTLHFSNKPITNHGDKTLTDSFFVNKDIYIDGDTIAWPWFVSKYRDSITAVTSENRFIPPKTTSYLFHSCSNLVDIKSLSSWKTSAVTDMANMFDGCLKLTDIEPLRHWNTSSVTDMFGMFTNCSQLNNLEPLSSWNTLSVKDMSGMFSLCTQLTSLKGLSSWKVSSVNYMRGMFETCSQLKDIEALSSWNILSVTDISYMFSSCSQLNNVEPLASWNTSLVTDMTSMFDRCSKITTFVPLNSWNVSKVTRHTNMFRNTTGARPSWGTSW